MKNIISFLFLAVFFTFTGSELFAQHRKLTVILFRHAEKDLSEGADTANPELSAAGKLRAEKLVGIVNKYQPDAIYSTDYIRTRATVRPLAKRGRHMVLMYDPRNLNQMRDMILSGKLKRIVVVGHNTTTPALANLLIGQDKYKQLDESEYDKLWVIKIKRNKEKPNKIEDTVIQY
jgi:broad specificity phosphatase PhoE